MSKKETSIRIAVVVKHGDQVLVVAHDFFIGFPGSFATAHLEHGKEVLLDGDTLELTVTLGDDLVANMAKLLGEKQ